MQEEKIFVAIDANAIVHRAFHAYPPTLTTTDGLGVNAVYGFTVMLLDILKRFHPEYIACAFDTEKPTFRHVKYTDYKATRKPTDFSLIAQFPLVEEVLKAFNIPILKKEGYEADDILGTIANRIVTGKWSDEIKLIIVSGDRDLLQLIDEKVSVCLPQGNFKSLKAFNKIETYNKYGYYPEQVIEYKALVGDASDNIPGIKGIGEKTAIRLLQQYKDLKGIYEHLEEIKGRVKTLLVEGVEQAEFSKDLATIFTEVPVDFKLEDCLTRDFKYSDVIELFGKFQFRSLVDRIPESGNEKIVVKNSELGQIDMFSANVGIESEGKQSNQVEEKLINSVEEDQKFFSKLQEAVEIDSIYLPREETFQDEDLLFCHLKTDSGEELFAVIHENNEKHCFTNLKEKVKRETWWFNLKGCVSRKDVDLLGVRKNLNQSQFVDLSLLAHFLDSGLKDMSFSSIYYKFTNKLVQSKFAQSDIALLFDKYFELKKVIKEEFQKRCSESIYGFDFSGTVLGNEIWNSYHLDLESIFVLEEMEQRGIRVDLKVLESVREDLVKFVFTKEREIYNYVGHEFNINSPKQLASVLYSQLGIQSGDRNGKQSTREEVLLELQATHPFVNQILEYREGNKLLNTYVVPLKQFAQKETEDGKDNYYVHTNYNITGTTSGRLSSEEPNMQNLPVKGEYGKRIKEIFIPRDGFKFVSIDYSQIELRIMADFSKDENMINDFIDRKDIHKMTAARIFKKSEDDVSPEERRIAKTINFGILYGQTAYGLSRQLQISTSQATMHIQEYFNIYKGVVEYIDKLSKIAQKQGYVETMFGRRRYIKGLDSPNRNIRNSAIREAINMPLQGTAADIMKLAMIKVDKLISEKYLDKAFSLLQIHDELVFEVQANSVENFETDAKEIMERIVGLDVPLEVHVNHGDSLAELK